MQLNHLIANYHFAIYTVTESTSDVVAIIG
jgi:hypothetical protein